MSSVPELVAGVVSDPVVPTLLTILSGLVTWMTKEMTATRKQMAETGAKMEASIADLSDKVSEHDVAVAVNTTRIVAITEDLRSQDSVLDEICKQAHKNFERLIVLEGMWKKRPTGRSDSPSA